MANNNNADSEEMDTNTDITDKATLLLQQALGPEKVLTFSQKNVINLLCQHTNVLFIDRTGGGKSASYFLATKILRDMNKKAGPTFVISPLLALMKDQVINAQKFGLNAKAFNSDLNDVQKAAVLTAIRQNSVDVIYITPEMLTSPKFADSIDQFKNTFKPLDRHPWHQVSIVIDEAHCVSDWGHDFRLSYYKGLKATSERVWFQKATKLATSATINGRVETDLQRIIPNLEVCRGNLNRDNIAIRVIRAPSEVSKQQWLLDSFTQWKDKNVLIFVERVDQTNFYSKILARNQIASTAYHAGLKSEIRTEIENQFRDGKIRVLVSTLALGMGFDKSDIHIVVHMYTPSSPIQYYQEIGRAGRNPSMTANAYLVCSKPWRNDDGWLRAWKRIYSVLKNSPNQTEYKAQLEHMLAVKENTKNDAIKKAFDLAIKREYIIVSLDNQRVSLGPHAHESDQADIEYNEQRNQEKQAMENLQKANKCIWNSLLEYFGQKMNADWRCGSCSYCLPETAEEFSAEHVVNYCYRSRTPNGILVYALGVNNDNVELSVDRVRAIINTYINEVQQTPPNWALCPIPNTTSDMNHSNCSSLAEGLGLAMFSFAKPVPGTEPLTTANTPAVRQERVLKKFPDGSFQKDQIPSFGGVVIYDDAMKSGTTIDRVSKPLREAGREIVAIVQRVWTGNDLPPTQQLPLEF